MVLDLGDLTGTGVSPPLGRGRKKKTKKDSHACTRAEKGPQLALDQKKIKRTHFKHHHSIIRTWPGRYVTGSGVPGVGRRGRRSPRDIDLTTAPADV